MSLFRDLGNALAAAETQIAKAIGENISYTHRDNDPVVLRASIMNITQRRETFRGKMSEYLDVTFLIPKQAPVDYSGFSGTLGFSGYAIDGSVRDITQGDKIEWPIGSNRIFFVANDGVELIHNGTTYIVKAMEQKVVVGGQRA